MIDNMPFSARPTVIFFTPADLVSVYLVDGLLQKGCVVYVVADDPSLWKSGKIYLTENPHLNFVSIAHVNQLRGDYVLISRDLPSVLASNSISSRSQEKLLKAAENFLVTSQAKLIIYQNLLTRPKAKNILKTSSVISNYRTKKIIYLGDIFGVGMDSGDGREISNILKAIAFENKIIDFGGQYIFPLFVADAVNHIIRQLFSYWSSDVPEAVANAFNFNQFLKTIPQDLVARCVTVAQKIAQPALNSNANIHAPSTTTSESLKSTIEWISQNKQVSTPAVAKVHTPKLTAPRISLPRLPKMKLPKKAIRKKEHKPLPKPVALLLGHKRKIGISALLIIVWFMIIPVVALSLSLTLLSRSYTRLTHGESLDPNSVSNTVKLSAFSYNRFVSLASTPVVGQIFTPFAESALLVQRASDTLDHTESTIKSAAQLSQSILGDKPYNLNAQAGELYLSLDALYNQTSFLEGEIKDRPGLKNLLGFYPSLVKSRKYLLAARDLVARLPVLIGGENRKTYLVLLQNNSELRPTGGFLGSYALVTFENSRLTDISVYDVYTADGQLKGHVEPPFAIKQHLGEASWYLRDSNWDPDFVNSSDQAEWFLEKEMERKVDGVIGIDLQVLKTALELTGSVNLVDLGETVTADNVYEKIQYEVEDTFFPGSQKKTTMLTSLSKQIVTKLINQIQEPKSSFGQQIVNLLEARHIQIALNDTEAAQTMSELGWDGSVSPPKCDCETIWLGMAEANVGVNKANYFIKRKNNLEVNIKPDTASFKLDVSLENTSRGNSFDLGGRYKAYLRLLLPKTAKFDNAQIIGADGSKAVSADVYEKERWSEAGILVELAAGESKKIELSWNQELDMSLALPGKIQFYWRKQAGTEADPTDVSISFPGLGRRMKASPAPSLTGSSFVKYNTNLEKDINFFLNW